MVKYFFLILILSACTTAEYKWYGLELPNYDKGKLLGPGEKDDVPLKICEPDQFQKGKCIVILATEFERMVEDYSRTKLQLKDCQGNR
jgi:hypothetical protein